MKYQQQDLVKIGKNMQKKKNIFFFCIFFVRIRQFGLILDDIR